MPALSPAAVTALRAAHAAAAVHRRFFRRLERVEYKGRNDPVTEADRAAEEAIVGILREAFPSHAILGEEGGQRGASPTKGEEAAQTWLVDPLDGTSNYARGIPWFCVSIALRGQAGIVLGVILNPIIGEVYAAERGRGAFAASLTGLPPDPAAWGDLAPWRRLHVSPVAVMADAGFATGFPHNVVETRINIDHFVNIRLETAVVRAIGSAALALAYVAAGHLEGYWEIGPKAWDFGAGMVIVEEAGGRISDLRGRPLAGPDAGQLLATNGAVHEAAVAVFARGKSGLG
ncbi:MAG TPA: inositol monophosphatase family protein [bacterium]|nr:inositol monophosphatase family protein [bacterium]